MSSDSHSRTVAWLKVLFPLTALALLSTLFLLSRSVDPESQIPFADKEIKDRLRDQQVTGPFFSGTTANGDQISFSAERMTTPEGQTGANTAEDVHTEVTLASGATVSLTADQANVDLSRDYAELVGSVTITTSSGYRLTSDRLTSELTTLNLVSPGPVEGLTPGGRLSAGSMLLTSSKSGEGAQLVFTNRVKLIYTPSDPD